MLHGSHWAWDVGKFLINPFSLRTNISIDRSLTLPASEAAESGFKPDQVKINEKYGGGFPANVEGLHHLHCLVCQFFWTQCSKLTFAESCETSVVLQL